MKVTESAIKSLFTELGFGTVCKGWDLTKTQKKTESLIAIIDDPKEVTPETIAAIEQDSNKQLIKDLTAAKKAKKEVTIVADDAGEDDKPAAGKKAPNLGDDDETPAGKEEKPAKTEKPAKSSGKKSTPAKSEKPAKSSGKKSTPKGDKEPSEAAKKRAAFAAKVMDALTAEPQSAQTVAKVAKLDFFPVNSWLWNAAKRGEITQVKGSGYRTLKRK